MTRLGVGGGAISSGGESACLTRERLGVGGVESGIGHQAGRKSRTSCVEGQVGRVGWMDSLYYRGQVEQAGMEGVLWWV